MPVILLTSLFLGLCRFADAKPPVHKALSIEEVCLGLCPFASAKPPVHKALSIEEVCDLGYKFVNSITSKDGTKTWWLFELRDDVAPPFKVIVDIAAHPTKEDMETATLAATMEAILIREGLNLSPKASPTPNSKSELHL